MKTTPFTEKHIALGAKMHEFAGYNMPIEYSGIIDEHLTVCNAVGVFDVSHMGEFWVKGPQALAFLQKVTSNNVAALVPGKIQYTCFPNEEGGIVDDLLVYCYEPEKYLLVVNAANIEKDWDWCVSHNTEGAELENSSDNMAQLAVQGPKAILALQKLTDIDLSAIPYYTFTVGRFAGKENVIISNTGYTGAGGFELYFYPDAAEVGIDDNGLCICVADNAYAGIAFKFIKLSFKLGSEICTFQIVNGANKSFLLTISRESAPLCTQM